MFTTQGQSVTLHLTSHNPVASPEHMYRENFILKTKQKRDARLEARMTVARSMIEQLGKLADGWDGYDAEPITAPVRINAWRALECFRQAGTVPEIVPNANGTVSFEWETPDVVAHFQVGVRDYSMYVRPTRGETRYFDGSIKDLDSSIGQSLVSLLEDSESDQRATFAARVNAAA